MVPVGVDRAEPVYVYQRLEIGEGQVVTRYMKEERKKDS